MPDATTPLLAGYTKKDIFGITPMQLCALVDDSRRRSSSLLAAYGGVSGICNALRVDPSLGLFPDEAFDAAGYDAAVQQQQHQVCRTGTGSPPKPEAFLTRKKVLGRNWIPKRPPKTLLALIVSAYHDQTLVMLTLAALVSLCVGFWEDHLAAEPKRGWIDGIAIIAAVIVVVLTNAINDYEKEKQFRKLAVEKENQTVKVLRGGTRCQIDSNDLVVGDVLLMEAGDILTVDCLCVEGGRLLCDESIATGESRDVKKLGQDTVGTR
ncbi:E1-E2 ATPase-domain-containing protein [Dichotomocladium elegans]|nr:E1-E2 ATPase-domain-containing protein [Dichotomocladium elegans]